MIHQHGPLLRHLDILNGVRGLTAERRLFSNSPMFWIGGLAYNLLGTLVAGSTLVCSRAEDPAQTLDLIERERPDMTNGYAESVAALVADPSYPTRDFSFIRSGNLYGLLAEDVRPADIELRHNMLGMTELGSVGLISPDETDQPEQYRGSFGRGGPRARCPGRRRRRPDSTANPEWTASSGSGGPISWRATTAASAPTSSPPTAGSEPATSSRSTPRASSTSRVEATT